VRSLGAPAKAGLDVDELMPGCPNPMYFAPDAGHPPSWCITALALGSLKASEEEDYWVLQRQVAHGSLNYFVQRTWDLFLRSHILQLRSAAKNKLLPGVMLLWYGTVHTPSKGTKEGRVLLAPWLGSIQLYMMQRIEVRPKVCLSLSDTEALHLLLHR